MNSIKMTTKNFIIKEGRVCCTDKEVPEDKCVHLPREFFATDNDYEEHYKCFIECGNRYESALQQIKDNAVLIREEDQDLSRKLIYNQYDPDNCNLTWCGEKGKRVPGEVSCYNQCSKYKEIKDDTFYPVSVEVEIVTKGVCCSPIPPNINHHNDCDKCEGYSELKLARIVEEPEEKEPNFKLKASEYADLINHSDPINREACELDFAAGCNYTYENYINPKKDSQVEDQEELRSTFTNPTENEVAEMVVSAYRVLIEHDKFAMMDYIFDKTKIRFLKLKENFGLDSGSLPFNEVDSLNKTKLLMDVWQKWCELDYDEFDGWLHSELHKHSPVGE
jgi:hypothetical protein